MTHTPPYRWALRLLSGGLALLVAHIWTTRLAVEDVLPDTIFEYRVALGFEGFGEDVRLATYLPASDERQVVLEENFESGDPGRQIGLGEHGHSVFFRNLNRGKKSVSLNLRSPAAREALLRIAEDVDVLIEAFRPGVAARLGFDYETVRARNPRIVYCSISAFGQTGPYRDVPAHDLACEACAGIVSVNLGNDDQPAMPPVPAADFAAASMGLAGVLMALYRREKTGIGDRIDISMHDSALAWLPNVLGPVFVEKRAPVPKHERTWGGSAFYRIYRTSDARHVVLGGQEIKFVRNLLTEWGRPDLIEPKPTSAPARPRTGRTPTQSQLQFQATTGANRRGRAAARSTVPGRHSQRRRSGTAAR